MNTRLLAALLFYLFTVPLHAQMDQPLDLSCIHPAVARAEIRGVTDGTPATLTVTPVNPAGEHVAGLTTADFRITKGKKEAEILSVKEITAVENTVMRVVFMVDNSQSMSPHLRLLRETLDRTIRAFSPAVRVAVMFFREGDLAMAPFEYNGKPLPLIRLPYTSDKPRAAEYVSKLLLERNLSRNTYLYDGVYAVSQQITADTGSVDRSFAIIFSDGEDLGSAVAAETALREEKYGTVFFTIDYLTKANQFLVDLATQTGGEHFQARNAEDLSGIFEAIANKIVAKGYTVTYRFKQPPTVSLAVDAANLVMEEEIIRETFPLLNYVFFEQGSAIIPDRYVRLHPTAIDAFDESGIEGGALDFYYNVLNVIGSRMRAQPAATITLGGYVNGAGTERKNATLARDRAQAVREYLRTVWGIDDTRITVRTGDLPPVPSSSRDSLGQAENRRVEIASDSWELLRPVTFLRRIAGVSPPALRIRPTIEAEEGLDTWILTVEQHGKEFDRRQGAQTEREITWNWRNRAGHLPASNGDLTLRMAVRDRAGDSDVSDRIPVQVREVRSERRQNISVSDDGITKEKISLILFPFDVAEPGERNARIMEEFVYPRITAGSHITVNGFTDAIGSEEYNQKLSQQRADAVRAVLLRRLGEDAQDRVTGIGHGETAPVFSNDVQEGRFYNRTVSLTIERYPR
ncbi:MAG: OmpA family protein [Bacteroidota bacterium]|jgi:outer membrane protein OmpA-like peptidoglycan-associated protein|nr:OmpA family protein [Bacteroidota bacterium]